MRASLAGSVLIVAGLLLCAYGVVIWAAIGRSDTATASLMAFGLTFAVPGLAAVAVGVRLLRRRQPP